MTDVRFEAAKLAAEASWHGPDMSWETALKAGISAYVAEDTLEVTEEMVDRAIGYYTSCESNDMRDMMRAALEGAQIRPATEAYAAGIKAGEEAIYETLNNPSIEIAGFVDFGRRHAARLHLTLGAARQIILALAQRLERVAAERDSWRRVSERLAHEAQHNRDIVKLG